jgi:DNA-binding XRE family transcriptional regulator
MAVRTGRGGRAGHYRARGATAAITAKPLKIPAALLARYQEGTLYGAELGRLLGVCASRAIEELRRLGIDTSKSHRRRLSIARRKAFADAAALGARVAELYAGGLSLRRVARETGLAVEGVSQVLLRQGVKLRGHGAAVLARCPPAERLGLQDFARRLRSLRTGAGLSQRGLAARCGLQQRTVSQLERAGTRPTWASLSRLARALGCGAEDLGLRNGP